MTYDPDIAKIKQLIADAHHKAQEWEKTIARLTRNELPTHEADTNAAYWSGVEDGLKRALNVLKGNG